jgi:hypothetical protein
MVMTDSSSPKPYYKFHNLPTEDRKLYKQVGDAIADALSEYLILPCVLSGISKVGILPHYVLIVDRVVNYFSSKGYEPADLNNIDGHEAITCMAGILHQSATKWQREQNALSGPSWPHVRTYAMRALAEMADLD